MFYGFFLSNIGISVTRKGKTFQHKTLNFDHKTKKSRFKRPPELGITWARKDI